MLEYSDFRNFISVIDKAREACLNSGHAVADHFVDITELVSIGGKPREEAAESRAEEDIANPREVIAPQAVIAPPPGPARSAA